MTVFMTVDDTEIVSFNQTTPNVSIALPNLSLAYKYFVQFEDLFEGIF